jgi:hypothetical protein
MRRCIDRSISQDLFLTIVQADPGTIGTAEKTLEADPRDSCGNHVFFFVK